MIVQLLAMTRLVEDTAKDMGYKLHYSSNPPTDGDELAEIAGRECYQSWHRPNQLTATNETYLGHILEVGHASVLEHASLTFSLRGISRSLTHELVRHRILSYSQLSQRYVDESDGEFVMPADIQELQDPILETMILDAHQASLDLYGSLMNRLTEEGVPRKRARQAARSVLFNGQATRLVVTANIRAWREMVAKRGAFNTDPTSTMMVGEPFADLEIFALARRVLWHLHDRVPNSVQDLWQTLYLDWEKTPYGLAQEHHASHR